MQVFQEVSVNMFCLLSFDNKYIELDTRLGNVFCMYITYKNLDHF